MKNLYIIHQSGENIEPDPTVYDDLSEAQVDAATDVVITEFRPFQTFVRGEWSTKKVGKRGRPVGSKNKKHAKN